MTDVAIIPQGYAAPPHADDWKLPYRGTVGMACLIIAEGAVFLIFVVAYIFYLGKNLSGPVPRDVLTLPVFNTICLLSSSFTVHFAVAALHKGFSRATSLWLAATVLLGGIFLAGTAQEWYQLIYHDGLTIRTNLFGTTYYSLVGLHGTHVILGLLMLSFALFFSLRGDLTTQHTRRLEVLSVYWHFVDAVWVVVVLVVYIIGK
jgi:cytochrome c oxidase subunit 3/cytochrome o ubiquinol oxidase subunit 3